MGYYFVNICGWDMCRQEKCLDEKAVTTREFRALGSKTIAAFPVAFLLVENFQPEYFPHHRLLSRGDLEASSLIWPPQGAV